MKSDSSCCPREFDFLAIFVLGFGLFLTLCLTLPTSTHKMVHNNLVATFSEVKKCPAGYYIRDVGNYNQRCTPCLAGFYCPGEAFSYVCSFKHPYFCDHSGIYECEPDYYSNEGQSSCSRTTFSFLSCVNHCCSK